MAIGHLTVAFDRKRPSATFVWPDAREAMNLTYVETVDHVIHLTTPDQRRIMLPLGETVEPIPGVRMKFHSTRQAAAGCGIEAPTTVRIVR
jgi:hypothetical protein